MKVEIEMPKAIVAEFEARAATMHLEAEEYCYAIIAGSLIGDDASAE